ILILQENSPHIRYCSYASLPEAQSQSPNVVSILQWDAIDSNVWSFDQPDLLKVYRELAHRHGTIADRRELQISVGLQTLYGKFYQFEPIEINPRSFVGQNGMGEIVNLEKSAMRPLCTNNKFYPFRKNNADAWVVFPYEINRGEAREIPWKEFQQR